MNLTVRGRETGVLPSEGLLNLVMTPPSTPDLYTTLGSKFEDEAKPESDSVIY